MISYRHSENRQEQPAKPVFATITITIILPLLLALEPGNINLYAITMIHHKYDANHPNHIIKHRIVLI